MDPEKIIKAMKNAPQNVRFSELDAVCCHFFGKPGQQGTSRKIYKTPWQGDPRINIQNDNGKAKRYQVLAVLAAIDKLREMERKR
ncbi:MAG: toxin HicA [Oxalobacter formigenes]|nr:toxin HicA [Oxalobacter formigenes]